MWYKLSPLRHSNIGSRIYNDVDSQLNTSLYRNPIDTVNAVHESSHGISSRIRNYKIIPEKYNGFYILNNLFFLVKEPTNLSLKDLANQIPHNHRGKLYNLYLVQATKFWNDTPTYCIDEANAYTLGTIEGIETKNWHRAIDSHCSALEMNIYCIYLAKKTQQSDILFFVKWLTTRNIILYQKIPHKNSNLTKYFADLNKLIKEL